MARLYLIRHGQTDWNAQGRLQGRIERSLDEHGREQARKVGEQLAHLPIAHVYSSPMQRARETAQLIASFHSTCKILEREALVEASFGASIEGLTRDEYHTRYAGPLQKRKLCSKEELWQWKAEEDSESLSEVESRIVPCLHQICKLHREESVLIVTHGGVIRMLLVLFNEYKDEGFQVLNGAVVQIDGDGEALKLVHSEGVNTTPKKEEKS
jgi:broad specificity phosphatase PhoE